MNYIIGIDIGTTNTKAVAYDSGFAVLAQSNSTYNYIATQTGYHELDPVELFTAALDVTQKVIAKLAGHQLQALCFSSAMHGLIAVDAAGAPMTNMITWADLRSSQYAASLKNTALGNRLYQLTGTPNHAMSPLCKLMWMKDNLPDVFGTAAKFISIKEFIFYRLFGKYVVDRSIASATGLFDIYALDWNEEALATAGITRNQLSEPVDATYILKGLKPEYGLLLGIDSQTPFVAGGSDGCLAHIGSNALQKSDISITIGTSAAVRILSANPLNDPRQRIFNYILYDRLYISGGPLNNGGNVLQWFARGFMSKDFISPAEFDTFIDEAFTVAPGSEGLIFLPYIYGERAPVWDADARGIFFGVSSVHTKVHFMRAIMEGISFALFSILEGLEEIAGAANNIYASGGFIRSKKWVTLLADVLGKKIEVTHAEDSSAAGAAIIGMKALGWIDSLQEVEKYFSEKETYLPDMEKHSIYRQNYSIYSNLYAKFKELKN